MGEISRSEEIDHELMSLLARGIMDGPCPILITSREGLIVYVNPAFTQVTGYALEELKGKSPRILKSSGTSPSVYENLWRTILSGHTWQGELCNRRKNGESFWESIQISGIRDGSGNITHFLSVWQDVTSWKKRDEKLERQRQILEKQSRTDDLTGLYNRRHIFVELGREFDRALRYGRPLSGMMIDIDNFKKINDEYGHLTGDRVLRTFSRVLEDSIRTIDILGRYGGDEFLLILPETELEEARCVAERIQKNLHSYQENVVSEIGVITASIGLVLFDESCRADKTFFFEKMDKVLFKVKQQGKNAIVAG